jgi:hypothetical protein
MLCRLQKGRYCRQNAAYWHSQAIVREVVQPFLREVEPSPRSIWTLNRAGQESRGYSWPPVLFQNRVKDVDLVSGGPCSFCKLWWAVMDLNRIQSEA